MIIAKKPRKHEKKISHIKKYIFTSYAAMLESLETSFEFASMIR